MGDVTRILADIERGDKHGAGQLLPLVYDERRNLAAARLAREAPGQSLQATALVHEAYLRLVGTDPEKPFDGRGHVRVRQPEKHEVELVKPRGNDLSVGLALSDY
jgi:hypothetical protein